MDRSLLKSLRSSTIHEVLPPVPMKLESLQLNQPGWAESAGLDPIPRASWPPLSLPSPIVQPGSSGPGAVGLLAFLVSWTPQASTRINSGHLIHKPKIGADSDGLASEEASGGGGEGLGGGVGRWSWLGLRVWVLQGEPPFSGTVGPENTITFSFFFAEQAVVKSQRRKEGPGRGRAAEYERWRQQHEWPRRRFSSSATTAKTRK
ncbi:hypothetical protein Acr_12g0001670 [Actinidia rufa]|uniref:Uncharacterized protein n=1 Tax=Actinidia rufa TaxID=165716 RepID=A0A7J0FGR6_9ERIC|nr:hypothetical protein Acr_12g0001670 [Actinidia rufa]